MEEKKSNQGSSNEDRSEVHVAREVSLGGKAWSAYVSEDCLAEKMRLGNEGRSTDVHNH